MSDLNLWEGRFVSTAEFIELLQQHCEDQSRWALKPLETHVLFSAVTKMHEDLCRKDNLYSELRADLAGRSDITDDEVNFSMQALIDFLNVDQLRLKLKRELGSEHPFELKRPDARENHFEAWYPLGTLVHVTPNNSPLLSVLGVIEGLLTGNINVLKLARRDSAFAPLFFKALCDKDVTGTLKNYLYIAKISSQDKQDLTKLLSLADVVSVWGGEESVQAIKDISPKGARIVEWGHKISFSYLTKAKWKNRETMEALAHEICLNEQMACSSPQCLYLEDASFADLQTLAEDLSRALEKVSPTIKRVMPGLQETAELTVTKEQVRLKSVMGESRVIEAKNREWRIYIENNAGLNSSPLFRTIWLKPMVRKNIIHQLRPLKKYLQTVGLASDSNETEELTRLFFMAGVQRIRSIGEMTDSYIGEPHDGVYALERFCQRINFKDSLKSESMLNKMSFEDQSLNIDRSGLSIMEKSDFQNQKVDAKYSDLFFYSGGSSGDPKLSVFTYADYHRQMELAAEGLFAAGLDPKTDRCMNLFYAGSLYGGFTSFFTILEKLQAVQFPMGASTDFSMVARTIIHNRVDTLLGMPSYLNQLFSEAHDDFKKYKGIKKIFYGGEHYSEAQRKHLQKEYGVEIIRSASYGSVDAGPLGYQCSKATGSIHHLHEKLHDLEVVEIESDRPVKTGDVGRLLFSSKVRHGQKIIRYAIGDVGRIVTGSCTCGRRGIRFELLGRHGDVFRIGTVFLSYQRYQKILMDKMDYSGSFQLHLYAGEGKNKDKVILKAEDKNLNLNKTDLQKLIIDHYADLKLVVEEDKVLEFETEIVPRSELIFNPTTGKLRSVIDHRIK